MEKYIKSVGKYRKIVEKEWKNHGKSVEKVWKTCGKSAEKSVE